jgi:AbrB family looped-hinge helix DNA binding protein
MEFKSQVDKSGRIVLPARLRNSAGIQAGDVIVLRLENGEILLIPFRQAVKKAQETVRQYVPAGTSLVDALIQARREEAARE